MLNQTFCSSPWFHLRLEYNGDFRPCRWGLYDYHSTANIHNIGLLDYYNGEEMSKLRTDFLSGKTPDFCKKCYYQDSMGKLSGRIRQLNKSGINPNDFILSAKSSPHYTHFLYSNNNNGKSEYMPVDLQIDLGNVCNSACIMCSPVASSKLHTDYIKLHKINPLQFKNPSYYKSWSSNPELLDKFVNDLLQIPNLKYIHFLGGETLYDASFYTICEKLIESGISKNITIGTTTNGTLYDDRIEELITQFKDFHLGISIETSTELNDYIRYPGKIENILSNIDKFLNLRSKSNLYINLRITPNIFTIYHYDALVDYMMAHDVAAESCDILTRPDCLRIELLPDDIRAEVILKLKNIIDKYNMKNTNIINARQNNLNHAVIADATIQYLNFLESYKVPADVEDQRHKLITFLKSFESIRNNSILDYVPRYTEFLRAYGY